MNLEIYFIQQKKQKNKQKKVHKNVVNLYYTLLAIYFNHYNSITDEEIEEIDKKNNPGNLFL